MSAIKLSSRYAKSLLDLAVEQNKLEEVYNDILLLKQVMRDSSAFTNLLKSPIINSDKKQAILKKILSGKVNALFEGFIEILVRKGRENYLPDVVIAFIKQYNDYKDITPVNVRSAVELSQPTLDAIVNRLRESADLKEVELTTEVDEELIGGFILKFEDKQMDASVARQLNELEKDFLDNKFIKQL